MKKTAALAAITASTVLGNSSELDLNTNGADNINKQVKQVENNTQNSLGGNLNFADMDLFLEMKDYVKQIVDGDNKLKEKIFSYGEDNFVNELLLWVKELKIKGTEWKNYVLIALFLILCLDVSISWVKLYEYNKTKEKKDYLKKIFADNLSKYSFEMNQLIVEGKGFDQDEIISDGVNFVLAKYGSKQLPDEELKQIIIAGFSEFLSSQVRKQLLEKGLCEGNLNENQLDKLFKDYKNEESDKGKLDCLYKMREICNGRNRKLKYNGYTYGERIKFLKNEIDKIEKNYLFKFPKGESPFFSLESFPKKELDKIKTFYLKRYGNSLGEDIFNKNLKNLSVDDTGSFFNKLEYGELLNESEKQKFRDLVESFYSVVDSFDRMVKSENGFEMDGVVYSIKYYANETQNKSRMGKVVYTEFLPDGKEFKLVVNSTDFILPDNSNGNRIRERLDVAKKKYIEKKFKGNKLFLDLYMDYKSKSVFEEFYQDEEVLSNVGNRYLDEIRNYYCKVYGDEYGNDFVNFQLGNVINNFDNKDGWNVNNSYMIDFYFLEFGVREFLLSRKIVDEDMFDKIRTRYSEDEWMLKLTRISGILMGDKYDMYPDSNEFDILMFRLKFIEIFWNCYVGSDDVYFKILLSIKSSGLNLDVIKKYYGYGRENIEEKINGLMKNINEDINKYDIVKIEKELKSIFSKFFEEKKSEGYLLNFDNGEKVNAFLGKLLTSKSLNRSDLKSFYKKWFGVELGSSVDVSGSIFDYAEQFPEFVVYNLLTLEVDMEKMENFYEKCSEKVLNKNYFKMKFMKFICSVDVNIDEETFREKMYEVFYQYFIIECGHESRLSFSERKELNYNYNYNEYTYYKGHKLSKQERFNVLCFLIGDCNGRENEKLPDSWRTYGSLKEYNYEYSLSCLIKKGEVK